MSGTYQEFEKGGTALSNASKVDFVACISHEIRTPMNAVLGFCNLLEQKHLTEEERHLVLKIRAAGDTLLGIINEILDFYKIESGQIQLDTSRFRLGEVYDKVISKAFASLLDKPIGFEPTPLPNHVEFLTGDPYRLEQILNNLISNAVKFTQHGKIQLITSLEEVSKDDVKLRFIVRDTGSGIAGERVPQIFTPFAQFEEAATGRFGGAGLGLSISQRLVELMGGQIGVNSQLGVGSEFWIVLPFQKINPSNQDDSILSSHLVLIADENKLIRDELLSMVKGFGWRETVAESGQKAVEYFEAAQVSGVPFNVVILDWRMRGKHGMPLLPVLRELGGEKAILVATAHDSEGLTEVADLADAVMSKFANASTLFNTVMNLTCKRGGRLSKLGLELGAVVGNRLEGLQILVVDDNEINLEVAYLNLQAEGAVVFLAMNGEEAINWLKENPKAIDIVLMDVQMPVMDGFEATRVIRQSLGLKDLPVVALTAGVFKNEQEAAKAAGMDGFIPKPFNMDTVVETVQALTRIEAKSTKLNWAVQSRIAQKPLINVQQGINTWMNEANYVKYLKYFHETYSDTVKKLGHLLEKSDVLAAVSLAHKIRGTAANLALPKLEWLAEQAESQLGKGLEIYSLINQLQSGLEETLVAVNRYIQTYEEPEKIPATSAELSGLILLLKDLMNALNMDKPEGAEQLLERLANTLPENALHEIRKAVDAFDFAQTELLNLAIGPTVKAGNKR